MPQHLLPVWQQLCAWLDASYILGQDLENYVSRSPISPIKVSLSQGRISIHVFFPQLMADLSEIGAFLKGVTAKMWLSFSISGHTLVMESLKLGPRVKAFKEENDLNNLPLGPSLGDSITKVWTEIERLGDIFAVTPFNSDAGRNHGRNVSRLSFSWRSLFRFFSPVPSDHRRYLGDLSGMAEYIDGDAVLFCRWSACWALQLGPNTWRRVSHTWAILGRP